MFPWSHFVPTGSQSPASIPLGIDSPKPPPTSTHPPAADSSPVHRILCTRHGSLRWLYTEMCLHRIPCTQNPVYTAGQKSQHGRMGARGPKGPCTQNPVYTACQKYMEIERNFKIAEISLKRRPRGLQERSRPLFFGPKSLQERSKRLSRGF